MSARIFHIVRNTKLVIKNYFIDSKNSKAEKDFIKLIGRYKIPWNKENKKIILVPIVDDYAMCVKLAAPAFILSGKENANIGLYSVATQVESWFYRNHSIWDTVYAEVVYRKLDKIFLAFGGKLIHRNVYNENSSRIQEAYQKIIDHINDKEDVLGISVEGIKIGDLVYDTYLRFAGKPTVDIQDPFLSKVIYQAIQIFYKTSDLFDRFEIKAVINSYTAYIQFGINVRIALQRNIPVYTIASGNSLVHRVLPTYPSHNNNHFAFKYLFDKLKETENYLNTAKAVFEKRFTGEIDAATSYMKVSAYACNDERELILIILFCCWHIVFLIHHIFITIWYFPIFMNG